MNTAAAAHAICSLELTPNSVLFVDATAIDVEKLQEVDWPHGMPSFLIVPVVLEPGQAFSEVIAKKELAPDVLEVYRAMAHVLTGEQMNAVTEKVMELRDSQAGGTT